MRSELPQRRHDRVRLLRTPQRGGESLSQLPAFDFPGLMGSFESVIELLGQ